MQKMIILCDIPIKSYEILNIVKYGIIQTLQSFWLSNIVLIYTYFYGPIEKKMFHNTSFHPYFHWKNLFIMIVFVGSIISKI